MKPGFSISLSGISKFYPGVVALDDVSLHVGAGEVVGLVGENGAGKSTLMKVLGGSTAPDRGSISIDGEEYDALTPTLATALGIAFVHQELNLFGNLDVAANVFIGREPYRYGLLRMVDNARLQADAQSLLDRLGATFSPSTPVNDTAPIETSRTSTVGLATALVKMKQPDSRARAAATRSAGPRAG